MSDHLQITRARGWNRGIPTCRTWAENRNPHIILKRSPGTPKMVEEGLLKSFPFAKARRKLAKHVRINFFQNSGN